MMLLARAVYEAMAGMFTVTGLGGQRDTTYVGLHPLRPLAKLMVCQLFMKEPIST